MTSKTQAAALVQAGKVQAIAKRMVATYISGTAQMSATLESLSAERQAKAQTAKGQRLLMFAAACEGMVAYASRDAFKASMGEALAKALAATDLTEASQRVTLSKMGTIAMALAHGASPEGRDWESMAKFGLWYLAHHEVTGYAHEEATAEEYPEPAKRERGASAPDGGAGTPAQQERALRRAFQLCSVDPIEPGDVKALARALCVKADRAAVFKLAHELAVKAGQKAGAAGASQPVKVKAAPAAVDPAMIAAVLAALQVAGNA